MNFEIFLTMRILMFELYIDAKIAKTNESKFDNLFTSNIT